MTKKASPKPRKKSGPVFRPGGIFKKALITLLVLMTIGFLWLMAKNYMKTGVREELESIVGELDQEPISIRVQDLTAGQIVLDQLKTVESHGHGSFRITKSDTGPTDIRLETLFDKKTYRIHIYWEPLKAPAAPKGRT